MKKAKTTDGIHPWKIDNPLEKILALKADKSLFWKKLYVQFYKVFDRRYYEKGLIFIDKNIRLFVGELTEKQRMEYIIDMVYSLHRFGCMFDEYFLYNFPMLNKVGRESFVTDKLRWSYYARMNTSEGNELFNDKKKTYDLFKQYYKRDLILILGEDDKQKFLDFVKKHKSFIVKPYDSSGGRGVKKLSVSDETASTCFKELILEKGSFVCEEVIVQSESLASFHPQSVNTVRLTTIKDKNGNVQLFHPLLRTGCGESVIDNATGGGIFALIDAQSGVVCTEAKDEKGNTFLSHPDTGVVYPGFKLPEWDNAIKLVNELVDVVEENHYVGWDLAHTENGWVMIEGNPRGQMIMMQLFFKNGFKDELEQYIKR